MMSMQLSLLLKADVDQAIAGLNKVEKDLDELGNTAVRTHKKGKKGADDLGNANQLAAGQVGNLTAQFNDIGIMLASGQNPLQLALQQGTQITQVIGPMGATGAVRALGSAFLQMLNPVSLITIGSIAAGAAMIGWLRNAWPEAKSLDDAMQDLTNSTKAYGEAAARSVRSGSDLVEDFGTKSTAIREQLRRDAEINRAEALANLKSTASAISDTLGGFDKNLYVKFSAGTPVSQFQVRALEIQKTYDLTGDKAAALLDAMTAINDAATPGEAIDAASEFGDALYDAFENASAIPDQLRQIYLEAAQYRDVAGQILALDEADARAQERRVLAGYAYYAASRVQSDTALRSANEIIARLTEENAIHAAALQNGEDSVEVTRLRADAERRVFEEKLATLDVAESVKDEMRKAFEEGQRLAQLDMSGGIRAALVAASELVDLVASAANEAERLRFDSLNDLNLQVAFEGDPAGLAGARARQRMEALQAPLRDGAGAGEIAYLNKQLEDYVRLQEDLARNRSKRGSGSKPTDQQAHAIADLIQKERDELDILRAIDPVQKELIRNRKALSGATNEERQMVTALIEERIREQARLDDLQESYDFWGQSTLGIFDDLMVAGKDFDDVMGNLARTLASAALQATILGTGPMAGLFGVSPSTSLFGSIFGGLFKAEGGLIDGPGGPTDDKVMTFTSPGEYIVRAAQTSKHLALLEAINSGRIDQMQGFASGGMVTGGVPSLIAAPPMLATGGAGAERGDRSSLPPARLEVFLSADLEARMASGSEHVAVTVFRDGIEQFSNEALPHRVKQIARDERGIG